MSPSGSEQKRRSADSEERLRALFAGMTDLILVMDREGRYLEIVPTHPDLLYRPADELLGRTVYEVFPEAQADFFVEHIREALAHGGPLPMEYDLPIGEREAALRGHRLPAFLRPGDHRRADMTAQVEQYRRLVALERARADLAEHMNAEINHRARNNLAKASGLLYMQAVQAAKSHVAAALREAVVRIRTFVNLHERVYAAGVEEVDLLAALEQMVSTLRGVFSTIEADFAVTGEPYVCLTHDATNLVVAANELLMNALKHGHLGARGGCRCRCTSRASMAAPRCRCGTPAIPWRLTSSHTGSRGWAYVSCSTSRSSMGAASRPSQRWGEPGHPGGTGRGHLLVATALEWRAAG